MHIRVAAVRSIAEQLGNVLGLIRAVTFVDRLQMGPAALVQFGGISLPFLNSTRARAAAGETSSKLR